MSLDFLHLLHDDYRKYSVFVETGTHRGVTTFAMEPHFESVHTIEIVKSLYERIRNAYKGDKIQFHHGHSTDVLDSLLPAIHENTIIFLDGHWSGGETGRGALDVPLYEELALAMRHCLCETIVIIDDVRLFGKGPLYRNEIAKWEHINTPAILQMVGDRMTEHYFLPSELHESDRLVIHLKSV